VNFPKRQRARTATAIGIAAVSMAMVVGPGSFAADAARKIGSAAIKNNTIRSLDIRNETITGRDVKDGSLTAKDFSGPMRGATGPRGPAGPAGKDGTNGTTGTAGGRAETLTTWRVQHQGSTGNAAVNRSGLGQLPRGTQIEALKFVASGDFSSCDDAYMQVFAPTGARVALLHYINGQPGSWQPADLNYDAEISSAPGVMSFSASCYDFNNAPRPVPDFDATVTLVITERDTAAAASYN
jgi:hypothetical protein